MCVKVLIAAYAHISILSHRELRILKGIDNFLEQAAKSWPLALAFFKVDVCELPCHPTSLGSQVAIGAVETGHHIVQKETLKMILVWSL